MSVYIDQNGSRGYEPSDVPAANRLVYVDTNKNGSHEMGEPVAVTDIDGRAYFADLEPGEYAVGILTNRNTQPQVEPAGTSPVAELKSDVVGATLLSTSDLSAIWSVDAAGVATAVSSGNSPLQVDLGGPVRASIVLGDLAAAAIETTYGQQLVTLDLKTGELSRRSIAGLTQSESIRELALTQEGVFALVYSQGGNAIAGLDVATAKLGNRLASEAEHIAGGKHSPLLATFESDSFGGLLQLLDASERFAVVAEVESEVVAQRLVLSDDSSLLAIESEEGVRAFRFDGQSLELSAILADAAGPVSVTAASRLVTASADDDRKIVLWSTASWLPIGTTRTDTGSGKNSVIINDAADSVVLANDSGVFTADLGVAQTKRVAVASEANAEVRLGVQVVGKNLPPDFSAIEPRTSIEDTPDTFDPLQSGVVDPDGDRVWFALDSQPTHGRISFDSEGLWTYVPNENFNGADSALVRVYDGQSETLLRLEWDVRPVNDPPVSITVEAQPVSETTDVGALLGFVSIVDADRDASYRVATSDPRFVVEEGRIYLADSSLDFETESSIVIQVLATDTSDPSITIAAEATIEVADANEPPTDILVSSLTVEENVPAGIVGDVQVIDPDTVGEDGASEYEIFVSDDRFEVVDGRLRLKAGEQLNFEEEPTVRVLVTAREIGGEGFERTNEVVVAVQDRNDLPTQVELSAYRVDSNTFGAVVGKVNVVDEDGDPYDVSVSDDRFEVLDGYLKLRDGVSLSDSEVETVTLTVTAISDGGDVVSTEIPVVVGEARPRHQNPDNPRDVNGDGIVSPIDVLILINEINRRGAGPLPRPGSEGGEGSGIFVDVNGDGVISPIDVLVIINELNRARSDAEGEPFSEPGVREVQFAMGASIDEAIQQELNSRKDDELDALLRQLLEERLGLV